MGKIPLSVNEFLAIRVDQPFGSFYSVRLNSKFILQRAYSKSASFDGAEITGAQRKLRRERLKEIGEFIDSDDAMFPSSIIIAANYYEDDRLAEEDDQWRVEAVDEGLNLYKLIVPSDKIVCSIVDGQHRLFGFEYATEDFDLNCSLYLDLPPSLQASVFATVNFNQSPVDKSLAYNLFGYQLDRLDSEIWSPDLLAINLCRYFATTPGEFFCGHINFRLKEKNVPKGNWVISTAAFVDGVLRLISRNPRLDRYEINKKTMWGLAGRKAIKADESFSMREYFRVKNDKAIEQVISAFFNAVGSIFDIKDHSDHVFVKTIGISALFQLLNEMLLKYGVDKDTIDEFPVLLRKAKVINLEDTEFFPSSTKGQNRLLRMLLHFVLDKPFAEMELREEAEKELSDKAEQYRQR